MIRLTLLLAAGGLLAASAGCEARNQFQAPPPPKVTVAVPLQRPVQEYFETTGQTRAASYVDLRARVGGYLKEVNFHDGQLVKQGELLFVIDKATYQASVASAQANLAKMRAQQRLADQQLVRTRALAQKDAATESALDTQEAQRASALADVAGAEAALREAELNLDYTEIRAPFAGRMGRHQVDIGNLIVAGTTLLAHLETVDPMDAYFTLSERDLLRFMEMMKEGKLKVISEADPPKLDLALGDTGQFNFHGKLDFREFGIDPTTGTTERRAIFPNPDACARRLAIRASTSSSWIGPSVPTSGAIICSSSTTNMRSKSVRSNWASWMATCGSSNPASARRITSSSTVCSAPAPAAPWNPS